MNTSNFKLSSRDTLSNQQTLRIVTIELAVDSDWIDAGAHIGRFSRKFKEISPLGRGYSFEPIPSLCKIIENRIHNINKSISTQ